MWESSDPLACIAGETLINTCFVIPAKNRNPVTG